MAVVSTLGSSFSFVSHKDVRNRKFLGTQYLFTGNVGQEHDPSKYNTTTGMSTGPTNVKLIWIFVDNSEIYPSSHPIFPSKPKVDIASGSQITALITSALTPPKGDRSIASPFVEHVEMGN